ncbi:MAG: hypothetical protein DRJ40_00720 [Thermoprotei archaeon]|nr:MAG: hypothetical protein DRJ40_00720 [Thermoprotei archaeon]
MSWDITRMWRGAMPWLYFLLDIIWRGRCIGMGAASIITTIITGIETESKNKRYLRGNDFTS